MRKNRRAASFRLPKKGLSLQSFAAKGDGIAKKDGFVIFVPGTAQGETIKIRITAVKPSCAVAEKVV